MRFNILIVTNFVDQKLVKDDVELLKEYIESRTPLRLNVEYLDTYLSAIEFQSQGFFHTMQGREELFSIKDLHSRLRPLIPGYRHHAVFFIYRRPNSSLRIANWTYGDQLYAGTELSEIPFKDSWDAKGDVFRVLSHEIIHVFHKRALRAGVWTADTLDQYDDEMDPYSPNGNRARNLAELAPHWATVASQPILWLRLRAMVESLLANPSHMPQPLLKPVTGPISQPFGVRSALYKSGIHNGTDYAVKVGTEVLAPALGAITQVWANHKDMGNACTFEFSFEGQLYTMRILHLRKAPTKGIYERGKVIAYTGNTGRTTGPHAHIEVFRGKYRPEVLLTEKSVRENLVDPEAFFA